MPADPLIAAPEPPTHRAPAAKQDPLPRSFLRVSLNCLIASVTSSFLWFAVTFWIYLETQSVLATGIFGGSYMLILACVSIPFGSLVDHHHKKQVMLLSSSITLVCFTLAALIYFNTDSAEILNLRHVWFWLFSTLVLLGGVSERLRSIALSTTVTLLVPEAQRERANGLVGTIQGLSFIITGTLSGLAVGQLGMGWTILIAIAVTVLTILHLLGVKIPEPKIFHDPALAHDKIDLRGSLRIIHTIPGLIALIYFSTFNNFVGGVFMALMDPYGLTLFSVELWGLVAGLTGTGFIIGGLVVGKFGLGKNPLRTMLRVVVIGGIVGAAFTLRENWLLFALGMWGWMCLVPAIEGAEQTIIQKVVPYERQGRVFGFAQAVEVAAAPMTAFIIAPLAEYQVIPWSKTEAGREQLAWLLGHGEARGIALFFLIAGLTMAVAALLAFTTKTYRRLSETYETTSANPEPVAAPQEITAGTKGKTAPPTSPALCPLDS